MKAILLVNTHSRRGAELYPQAEAALAQHGVTLARCTPCNTRDGMLEKLSEAVREGIELAIVGGGDGAQNLAAGVLAGTDTCQGVLPMGTGNAFARDLGIPFDLAPACEVIATGKPINVDIGAIGDRVFLNVATVGLTTKIVQSLDECRKRRFGRLAYIYAVLKAFDEIVPFRARVQTDEGSASFESLQVVIGNGKYHAGRFLIGPHAGLTTGKLSLYGLEGRSKGGLLKLAARMPSGTQRALAEVHSGLATSGVLDTIPSLTSILDGEEGPQTPFRFAIRPAALRVLAPQDFVS